MDATPGTTLNQDGTGLQVWLPVRSGDERSHPLQMGIMFNSRGERRTKALEGTEVEQQTPSKWGWETRENKLSWPPTLHEFTMLSVALGDYLRWGGWPLINLIPCIIMILFDYFSIFMKQNVLLKNYFRNLYHYNKYNAYTNMMVFMIKTKFWSK